MFGGFKKIWKFLEKIIFGLDFFIDVINFFVDIITKLGIFFINWWIFIWKCLDFIFFLVGELFTTPFFYFINLLVLKICGILKLVLEMNMYAFLPFYVILLVTGLVTFGRTGGNVNILGSKFFHMAFIVFTIIHSIIKVHTDNGTMLSILVTIFLWILNSVLLVLISIFQVKKAILLWVLLSIGYLVEICFFGNSKWSLMRNFIYPVFFACENDEMRWASMNSLHKMNLHENGGLMRFCYSPCKEGYIPSLEQTNCVKEGANIPSYCAVQLIKDIDDKGGMDIGKKSYNDLKMVMDNDYNLEDINEYSKNINEYMNECAITFDEHMFIGRSVCDNGDTSKELSKLCKFQYCRSGGDVADISCLKHDNEVYTQIENIYNDTYAKIKNDTVMTITFSIIILLVVYVQFIHHFRR